MGAVGALVGKMMLVGDVITNYCDDNCYLKKLISNIKIFQFTILRHLVHDKCEKIYILIFDLACFVFWEFWQNNGEIDIVFIYIHRLSRYVVGGHADPFKHK